MNGERQKGRGLSVALLAFGLVALALGFALRGKASTDPKALAAVTGPLAARVQAALMRQAKALEVPAAEASRLPRLLAGLQDGVDAATFQDAFESEEWWAPYRSQGRVSALVVRGKVLASLFVETPPPGADTLTELASTHKITSGFIKGSGRVYAAAASRLEQPNKTKDAEDRNGVIILAEVVSQAALDSAAAGNDAALGISDGHEILLRAGTGPAVNEIGPLAGQEAAPPGITPQGLPRFATLLPGGLWLWSVGVTPVVLDRNPAPVVYGLWFVGGLLAIAGLVFILRRPSAGSATPSLPLPAPTPTPDLPLLSAIRRNKDPAVNAAGERPMRKSSGEISVSETVSAAVPAVDLAHQKPHVVGRYTLLDRIGEGGMAEIFRAILHGAEGFERTLVVKRMHPHLLSMSEAVSQFVDEARLQSGLAHPNIVSVFDFGRAGNDYFLALEYIAGKDLEKVVQRHMLVHRRPLPVPIAMTIVRELLLALEFAHTRVDGKGKLLEIVHRDVSLSNVLVSYAGEVKLGDFGIVKAETRVSKTQLGMVKGNAGYMSPEQARGEPVDARADVFAAGVVAFCCLVGHALYNTRELTPINQILRAAVGPGQTEFNHLEGEMAKFDPALVVVIKRAMASSVQDRLGSAGQFAQALRPFATATREDISHLMHRLFAVEISQDV